MLIIKSWLLFKNFSASATVQIYRLGYGKTYEAVMASCDHKVYGLDSEECARILPRFVRVTEVHYTTIC